MSIKAFKFTGALAAIQASKLVDAGASFLAGLDPQSATEADIKTAESHYTQVLTKRAEARKAYDDANAVSTEAKVTYDREVAGLKLLAEKASKTEDAQEKARLSGKVDAFETELAAKKSKVQSLIATTAAKKQIVDTYDTIVAEALQKFQTIRDRGQQAIDRLNLAQEQEKIALEQAEAAKLGSSSPSSFGIDALSRAADKAEISTQVSQEKASSLRPAASMSSEDPDVADAIAEANGDKPTSQLTISERIDRLSLS